MCYNGLLNTRKYGYNFTEAEEIKKSLASNELYEYKWNIANGGEKLYSYNEVVNYSGIDRLWNELDLLSELYEEDCKEWFLPVYNNFLSQ